MKKSTQQKLIKQIERLCEKQFRKGFQQGFHACCNGELTVSQVNKFRYDGIIQNYLKVKQPHTGLLENAKQRLSVEMAMKDMNELELFLDGFDFK
jgi:hypothetical protein